MNIPRLGRNSVQADMPLDSITFICFLGRIRRVDPPALVDKGWVSRETGFLTSIDKVHVFDC